MILKSFFGNSSNGEAVALYTLTDGVRFVEVITYGATIRSIVVPDKRGKLTDVVLGYNTLAEYENNGGYFGATVGRFCNRIEKGTFNVDGKQYKLFINDGENHLHGGEIGFDKKVFSAKVEGDTLRLSCVSEDGDENYPARLNLELSYTLSGGALKIEYAAYSNAKTVINITNHSYFNLNGEGSGSAMRHSAVICANEYTPTDERLIPHGEFKSVTGTPFDFRTQKSFERDINADDADLRIQHGYDVNYILDKSGYGLAAEVSGDTSGIVMQVFTDKPAMQLYTANFVDQMGKSGSYASRDAFCLETQFIPNCVNVPQYASLGNPFLDKGEVYRHVTEYKFY